MAVYIYINTLTHKCVYIYIYIYIYTHVYVYVHTNKSDCTETACELPSLPNNTAVKNVYTNRSGAKFWVDIYHWGAGLAVTGRISDIGQKDLVFFW